MSSKTLSVRFSAAVCILLILFVGQSLGQETKLMPPPDSLPNSSCAKSLFVK